jgi:hypothetical protein
MGDYLRMGAKESKALAMERAGEDHDKTGRISAGGTTRRPISGRAGEAPGKRLQPPGAATGSTHDRKVNIIAAKQPRNIRETDIHVSELLSIWLFAAANYLSGS